MDLLTCYMRIKKTYVDDEFSQNEIVEDSREDIFMENFQNEFVEDKYVEDFLMNEEKKWDGVLWRNYFWCSFAILKFWKQYFDGHKWKLWKTHDE